MENQNETVTAQAIVDFAYENDLIDGDEGEPLGTSRSEIDGLYAIATDPAFGGGSEEKLSALIRMIEQHRTERGESPRIGHMGANR